MKITDVTTYIAGNAWKNWVFTRVDTDEGLHGIGEATLNGFAKTVEAAIHELKRFVIGQDPFDVENHTLRLFRDVYSDGGQIQGAALAGLEFACWDIMGKATRQPVYKLIGGRCHGRWRAFGRRDTGADCGPVPRRVGQVQSGRHSQEGNRRPAISPGRRLLASLRNTAGRQDRRGRETSRLVVSFHFLHRQRGRRRRPV